MLDKHLLEAFLKVNHTSENMTEGEVRSVLSNAGWSEGEIEEALILLQRKGDAEPTGTEQQEITLQHFRPDFEFSSNQLSQLLGVDIELDPNTLARERALATSREDLMFRVLVGCAVVFVALFVVVGVMLWAVYVMGVDVAPMVDAL